MKAKYVISLFQRNIKDMWNISLNALLFVIDLKGRVSPVVHALLIPISLVVFVTGLFVACILSPLSALIKTSIDLITRKPATEEMIIKRQDDIKTMNESQLIMLEALVLQYNEPQSNASKKLQIDIQALNVERVSSSDEWALQLRIQQKRKELVLSQLDDGAERIYRNEYIMSIGLTEENEQELEDYKANLLTSIQETHEQVLRDRPRKKAQLFTEFLDEASNNGSMMSQHLMRS